MTDVLPNDIWLYGIIPRLSVVVQATLKITCQRLCALVKRVPRAPSPPWLEAFVANLTPSTFAYWDAARVLGRIECDPRRLTPGVQAFLRHDNGYSDAEMLPCWGRLVMHDALPQHHYMNPKTVGMTATDDRMQNELLFAVQSGRVCFLNAELTRCFADAREGLVAAAVQSGSLAMAQWALDHWQGVVPQIVVYAAIETSQAMVTWLWQNDRMAHVSFSWSWLWFCQLWPHNKAAMERAIFIFPKLSFRGLVALAQVALDFACEDLLDFLLEKSLLTAKSVSRAFAVSSAPPLACVCEICSTAAWVERKMGIRLAVTISDLLKVHNLKKIHNPLI